MESVKGRMVGVATVSMLLAGIFVVMTAIPAHASCAAEAEDAIADQEIVFVAVAIEQTDRHARVEVVEIWRGPDLAPTVWLQTTAAELPPWPQRLTQQAATSVDASLIPGTRYLIGTVDGSFRTNTCLVTEASDALVERLKPQITRQPDDAGATGDGPGTLEGTSGLVVAIVLLAAIPVGGWLTYRRFRTSRSTARGAS